MDQHAANTDRRGFLKGAGALAAVPLVMEMAASQAFAQPPATAQAGGTRDADTARVTGRRKLGSLEVSSVGLGVQNMDRT